MRKLSMFNISPFLNLSHCPNCSNPILPNIKCSSCKSFASFITFPSIAFYSNSASCLVTESKIVDYFDFDPNSNKDSIKNIIVSTFQNPNPNISLIFNYINKINTFK